VLSAAAWGQTGTSVRITMDTLHQLGGVPPGWRLTPPAGDVRAGRDVYVLFGCPTCHAVQGESFSGDAAKGSGPELTGMGRHHPPGYFVESILNPDAVIVEGAGYVGADGRSTMPRYPDMTMSQLANVVAYLQSLDQGGACHPAAPTAAVGPAAMTAITNIPSAPATTATRFLVQVYDIQPGQLQAFEEWFRTSGAAEMRNVPGLVSLDTYVDRTREPPHIVSVFAFADEQAVARFTMASQHTAVGQKFDSFIGPHGHMVFDTAPLYRSSALSATSGQHPAKTVEAGIQGAPIQ